MAERFWELGHWGCSISVLQGLQRSDKVLLGLEVCTIKGLREQASLHVQQAGLLRDQRTSKVGHTEGGK